MYQDRFMLTSQDILDKEFKIDTRGYRPQEVDKFLDVIIRDYNEMNACIRELEDNNKNLVDENMRLKQQIRNLSLKLDAIETNESNGTNTADVLRRLSNLEKIIYGKNN
ncbi:MAG: cell division regulator GpsB [Bacilli bacterium]|nr:cell division regulator GpsB [Bacilli bacterium]